MPQRRRRARAGAPRRPCRFAPRDQPAVDLDRARLGDRAARRRPPLALAAAVKTWSEYQGALTTSPRRRNASSSSPPPPSPPEDRRPEDTRPENIIQNVLHMADARAPPKRSVARWSHCAGLAVARSLRARATSLIEACSHAHAKRSPCCIPDVPAWVRQGVAAAVTRRHAGQQRGASISMPCSGQRHARPPNDVRLRGPPTWSHRQQPDHPDGTASGQRPTFDPNYFPCVEFDRPDFPWLFTPPALRSTQSLRHGSASWWCRKQDGRDAGQTPYSPLPFCRSRHPPAAVNCRTSTSRGPGRRPRRPERQHRCVTGRPTVRCRA